jgi:hypothetical protein
MTKDYHITPEQALKLFEEAGGILDIDDKCPLAVSATDLANTINAALDEVLGELWTKTQDKLPELINEHSESVGGGFKMPKHKTSARCLVVVDGKVTDSYLIWREDYPDLLQWAMLGSYVPEFWMLYPSAPNSTHQRG